MKFRGAEAIVETIEWNGKTVVSKTRNRRGYRHPSLEKKLVVERLRSESRIMERLLSKGISVPAIYSVNLSDNSIIMEFIDGLTLERALRENEFENYLVKTAEILSIQCYVFCIIMQFVNILQFFFDTKIILN